MIPEHLRPHLERLGAQIEPREDGSTEVYVPGAGSRWQFGSGGVHRQGELDTQATRLSAHPTPYNTLRLLHLLARNTVQHLGPTHRLTVNQFVPDTGLSRVVRSVELMTKPDPEGFDFDINHYSSTEPDRLFPNSMPDAVHQGAKAVLAGEMPIEALADELADHHNVSHLVRSQPEQYAKSYATAIRPPEPK